MQKSGLSESADSATSCSAYPACAKFFDCEIYLRLCKLLQEKSEEVGEAIVKTADIESNEEWATENNSSKKLGFFTARPGNVN